MEELTTCFRRLGMAKYPSSVLSAMIANPNSTALEISLKTGVPYTKIYQVLTALMLQGFASVSLERPKRYVAADCQGIVDSLVNRQATAMKAFRRNGLAAVREATNLTGALKFAGERSHALMEP